MIQQISVPFACIAYKIDKPCLFLSIRKKMCKLLSSVFVEIEQLITLDPLFWTQNAQLPSSSYYVLHRVGPSSEFWVILLMKQNFAALNYRQSRMF